MLLCARSRLGAAWLDQTLPLAESTRRGSRLLYNMDRTRRSERVSGSIARKSCGDGGREGGRVGGFEWVGMHRPRSRRLLKQKTPPMTLRPARASVLRFFRAPLIRLASGSHPPPNAGPDNWSLWRRLGMSPPSYAQSRHLPPSLFGDGVVCRHPIAVRRSPSHRPPLVVSVRPCQTRPPEPPHPRARPKRPHTAGRGTWKSNVLSTVRFIGPGAAWLINHPHAGTLLPRSRATRLLHRDQFLSVNNAVRRWVLRCKLAAVGKIILLARAVRRSASSTPPRTPRERADLGRGLVEQSRRPARSRAVYLGQTSSAARSEPQRLAATSGVARGRALYTLGATWSHCKRAGMRRPSPAGTGRSGLRRGHTGRATNAHIH